jgi:hypothetical protein
MADVIPYFRFVAVIVIGGLVFAFFNMFLSGTFGDLTPSGSVFWSAMLTIFTYIPAIIFFRNGIRLVMYQQKRRF